jgi:hypothetical protein
MLIAIQALIPAAAASLFWLPWTGSKDVPKPVAWLFLAVSSAAFVLLARRAWRESVTLTHRPAD